MNDRQPKTMIDDQRFEDKLLETAWGDVESVFRTSGMVAPLPGFTSRWMERLELERQKEERKQAWALIITNLVIALGFIILISVQFVPSITSGGGLVAFWVELVARLVLFLRMAGGLVSTLVRTIPALVPTSWWISGAGVIGIVVVLWVSMVRRHLRDQGVNHE